ncbi:hypothetical protein L6164_010555 [Bauhinia variegata]|uniref:Uncharacterized protein n=1 Tax=Bauhinia variegata TaxID=167791 RepID=A0ACB9PQF9_BAUVA|nr:hypothetical protein L6164_010555 [Bauhinia variegata]
MYKNQLQELAQRSCFNLPAYACIREGPDHAPRFKATVNFNGETFESPTFCSTLRHAEHAAAEIALNNLAKRGPSRALAARVLDETGVYKNLLQETAHRAGLNLPVYTTIRSGPGHVPVFSCTVEIAEMSFTGDSARTKKQAQKNAAMAAWSSLRKLSQHCLSSPSSSSLPSEAKGNDEQEQVIIARVLASLQPSESKNFSKSDHQNRRRQCSTTFSETTTPMSGMYPIRCQCCGISGFSPDVAMYQIWQQEQIIQQQNHLLALTIPPTIPSAPQIYPFMQSVLQPDHRLYVPARELTSLPIGQKFSMAPSSPSFYFSNHVVPNLIRGRSTVTIREIQEDKPENSTKITGIALPDYPLRSFNNETRTGKPAPEVDRQKTDGPERSRNAKLGDQTKMSEWASHESYKQVNLHVQNPPRIDTSQVILRPETKANTHRSSRPPPAASSMVKITGPTSASSRQQHMEVPRDVPPRMRTGVPRSSAMSMSMSERFNIVGAPPPRSMAPAVRIRSVVPVCSAPPRRSTQDEGSMNMENKDLKPQEVSRISSKLGNLGI